METIIGVMNLFVMFLGLGGAAYSRNATRIQLTPKILDVISASPELRPNSYAELLNTERAIGKQNINAAIWTFSSIALAGFAGTLAIWHH